MIEANGGVWVEEFVTPRSCAVVRVARGGEFLDRRRIALSEADVPVS